MPLTLHFKLRTAFLFQLYKFENYKKDDDKFWIERFNFYKPSADAKGENGYTPVKGADYFTEADKVYPYLYFTKEENVAETTTDCANIKVVITGKLQHFKNRDAFKECIEAHGGKVVDTVSKNTTYLVNNDVNSSSSKNQTAKKLGIPILSEQEFLEKFNLI